MEPILVPLIVFGFIALIVKMSLDFTKWKKLHESGDGLLSSDSKDNSLGVSELRNLIEESVQQANQPLLERISNLEHQLENDRVLIEKPESVKQLNEASSKDL